MTATTLNLTPEVFAYLVQNSLREPEILQELRLETGKLPGARMQISPEQGQFMSLLIELLQAKKTLDIGTFTGYSALVVALALPKDGKVITCDIDPKITDLAQHFWQKAGVGEKIDLRINPALTTTQQLLSAGEANTFDFVFIDADKSHYIEYYEQGLALLRPGGLIVVDNVLWGGRVANSQDQEKSTQSIRQLNTKIHQDPRVTLSMLPIGDGLTLARKKTEGVHYG